MGGGGLIRTLGLGLVHNGTYKGLGFRLSGPRANPTRLQNLYFSIRRRVWVNCHTRGPPTRSSQSFRQQIFIHRSEPYNSTDLWSWTVFWSAVAIYSKFPLFLLLLQDTQALQKRSQLPNMLCKGVLGPKYYDINGIWAIELYYLGPWTLGCF